MHFVHFFAEPPVVTPTVELNALAMKLGERPEYANLDTHMPPRPFFYPPMTDFYYRFRMPPPPMYPGNPYVSIQFQLSIATFKKFSMKCCGAKSMKRKQVCFQSDLAVFCTFLLQISEPKPDFQTTHAQSSRILIIIILTKES